MATSKLTIVIDALNKTGAINKDITSEFKMMAAKVASVTAALVAFGVAAKKAFDFGKEGAIIVDTEESFIRLSGSISEANKMLLELQKVSLGTVSANDLMSAAATAMAGSTGELSDAMWDALPALLQMAKAAVKLDPTLGTVDFTFQSLIKGIKKGQPLLIDNTNAVVKVGEANEKYAEALGITVEEMDASDRQMAILNATLEAGEVMLEQVGGSVETNSDKYAILTATMQDTKNALLEVADVMAGDVVKAINEVNAAMKEEDKLFQDYIVSIAETSGSYDEYIEAVKEAGIESGKLDWQLLLAIQSSDDLANVLGALTEEAWLASHAMGGIKKSVRGAKDEIEEDAPKIVEELGTINIAALEAALAFDGSAYSMEQLGKISLAKTVGEFDPVVEAADAMTQAFMDTFESAAELQRGMVLLKLASGELAEADREAAFESIQQMDRLEELQQAYKDGIVTKEQVREITKDITITEEELNEAMGRTTDELSGFERGAMSAEGESLALAESIDRVAGSAAALELETSRTNEEVGNLEGRFSVFKGAAGEVAYTIDSLGNVTASASREAEKAKMSWDDFGGKIGEIEDAPDRLTGTINSLGEASKSARLKIKNMTEALGKLDGMKANASVNVNYTQSGNIKIANLSTGVGDDVGFKAAGGPVSAGSPYIVGEEGPELFVPSGNGTIIPNGSGGDTSMGGGFTFVYSPTVSLGDRMEAENVIAPLIEGTLRDFVRDNGIASRR